MKHTFIKADGRHIGADTFMHGPDLAPGMVWVRDGDYGPWREVPTMYGPESDPNHRSHELHIFGVHYVEFLARQYY